MAAARDKAGRLRAGGRGGRRRPRLAGEGTRRRPRPAGVGDGGARAPSPRTHLQDALQPPVREAGPGVRAPDDDIKGLLVRGGGGGRSAEGGRCARVGGWRRGALPAPCSVWIRGEPPGARTSGSSLAAGGVPAAVAAARAAASRSMSRSRAIGRAMHGCPAHADGTAVARGARRPLRSSAQA
jgi:hypothetical protein